MPATGRVRALNAALGEAGFEVAQGRTAPGILLQYLTPCLPRTSISKIVLPKSSWSATVTFRNSGRHDSSGNWSVAGSVVWVS